MGGKSAPDAPDYRGAAEEQGASARENTLNQTYANRPNQTTPWGSSTWTSSATIDPSTGKSVTSWDQNLTLSPSEQAAFDSQSQIREGQSAGALQLMENAQGQFSEPMDFDQFTNFAETPNAEDTWRGPTTAAGTAPTLSSEGVRSDLLRGGLPSQSASALDGARDFAAGPEVGDIAAVNTAFGAPVNPNVSNELSTQQLNAGGNYNPEFASTQFDRQMSLEDPLMQRDTEAMETQLRNQGLTPGSEAYDNAMGDLRDQQGETRSRAAQDAMRLGADEQNRQFARELGTRQQGATEVMDEFGRNLGSSQFQNNQRQQEFDENQTRDAQRFDKELRAAGFSDSQRAQQVQERLANNAQQFAQQAQRAGIMDSQRAADFGEQFASREQQYAQQMGNAELGDTQRRNEVNEILDETNTIFGQRMDSANYQNTLRQAEIAEQMQARGATVNEINAILYGNQISQPNMPGFTSATKADATNFGGAAQNAGTFANQRYSTALGPLNSAISATGLAMGNP